VLDGNSPTVISRLAVAAELASGSLVEIVVDDFIITRSLRAVWTSSQQLPPLAAQLLDSLNPS